MSTPSRWARWPTTRPTSKATWTASIKSCPRCFRSSKPSLGPKWTYEEAPARHKQVEFAFDVVQLAAGRYRTEQYHDFIGFKVSKDMLERAFLKTYGLELGQVTFNVDLSIASYRFAVQQLMPLVSRAAWRQNRHDIYKTNPRARRRDYVFRESRADLRPPLRLRLPTAGLWRSATGRPVSGTTQSGPAQAAQVLKTPIPPRRKSSAPASSKC